MGSPAIQDGVGTLSNTTCGMWPSTMWPAIMWPSGSAGNNGEWPVCTLVTTPFQGCIVLFQNTDIVTLSEHLTAVQTSPLSLPLAVQDPQGISSPLPGSFVTYPTDLITRGPVTTNLTTGASGNTNLVATSTFIVNICVDCQAGECLNGY